MENNEEKIELIDKFTVTQKIIMGLFFWTIPIVGAYGIYIESILWGVIYTIYFGVGPFYLLGRHFCSHCPYPCEHSTCLFQPYQIPKKLFKYKPTPMTTLDKIITFFSFAPMSIIPLFWLYKNPCLLIIFITANVAMYGAFFFYFCKRCRNYNCPINRVKNR